MSLKIPGLISQLKKITDGMIVVEFIKSQIDLNLLMLMIHVPQDLTTAVRGEHDMGIKTLRRAIRSYSIPNVRVKMFYVWPGGDLDE